MGINIFPDFFQMHGDLYHDTNKETDFSNNDSVLNNEAMKVSLARKELGLEGLVGDLETVIINVEIGRLGATVEELFKATGYKFEHSFKRENATYAIMKCEDSADIVIKSEEHYDSPFREYNSGLKVKALIDTRLECFTFITTDINKYVALQRGRGVRFLTPGILEYDNYYFIQTIPSSFTGNSTGFIQWKTNRGNYKSSRDEEFDLNIQFESKSYQNNIGVLDHAATRVRAEFRDAALIEFMELTNYDFALAIYIKSLNSITNVARLTGAKYAAVFTSGIKSFVDEESSGPTEMFIHNYGTRVHHLAFNTVDISYTYASLSKDDYRFMSEVVGSEHVGIKQAFSSPSPNTLIVNEYIERYGSFDGFFIEENVKLLTKATENQ